MLARFEAGEIGPDEWRMFRLRARHVRPAADERRADAPRQDSAGRADERAARRPGRCRRALLARLRAHHDAAEHPVPLHQAARRRARDARARRRRDHDARGLRQLGPQHHRLPVRRRRAGRSVRRHAVRRGADALPAAASAERRRSRASSRSRSRAAPTDHVGSAINDIGWNARVQKVDGRTVHGFQVTVAGGTATLTRAGQRPARVPARRPDVRLRGSDHPRLPSPRRLQAQAEQSPEVPRQVARMGHFPGRVRARARALDAESDGARPSSRLPFERDAPPIETAPPPSDGVLPIDEIAAARSVDDRDRPRHRAESAAAADGPLRGVSRLVAHQRPSAETGRLRIRDRRDAARGSHVRPDASAWRHGVECSATAACGSPPIRTCSLGGSGRRT